MELPPSSRGSSRRRFSLALALAKRAGWPWRRAYRAADQCADFVAFFDPRCDGADFGYGHLVCSTVFFAMTAGYATTLAVVLILAVCAIYMLCRGQRSR
jgi:hypothetical protein